MVTRTSLKNNHSLKISALSFDSNLFGYPVGKIQIQEEWEEKEFLNQAESYQLVYLFSKEPIELRDSRIQLVDTKLTYKKSISESNKIPLDILPYSGEINEKLLELALDSGVYSRFKVDPRLTQSEFTKLYKLWIKMAWESNAILEAPRLQGMVTYRLVEKSANIGLIAVAKKSQGKGWGKKLIHAAEMYVANQGIRELRVVTQEANSPACNLYESTGFDLRDRVFVYHYWKG